MASGRPDFRWTAKIRASAAFCLVGAVAGTVLYFGNLAYVRAGDKAAPAQYRDGADPYVTGCSRDARTLGEVPVYLPSDQRFGTLQLLHSPACAMSWGAVSGPNPRLYRVYIIARRPASAAQEHSSYAQNIAWTWGFWSREETRQ